MSDTDLTPELAELYRLYDQARSARLTWAAQEATTREALLFALGYKGSGTKVGPTTVVDKSGTPVFRVAVGTWRGLDQKGFREKHPDLYAEFETCKPTFKIRT